MDVDDLFSVFDEVKESKKGYDPDDILKQEKCDQINDRSAIEFVKSILQSKRHGDLPNDKVPKKPRVSDVLEGINPDDFISRMDVHTIDSAEDCLHEVVLPSGIEFKPLKPRSGVPAREYKFTLDSFQSEAIHCLDNNQSVLVSAHTSAGKTVVAEYAVALSLRDNQRVIYTTPIKALSNQKYREFVGEFNDVGLVTGDVTINPSASCLIMTVEILRNMLYRGSEVMREIGWVIFDEVHYMRDKSRGVVWEETIILLPDFVHYVFLSATIPNARQFAQWICHLHKQPCHVVYTDYRPVPLKQYIFPAGGDDLHVIVDVHGNFMQKNFDSVMADLYLNPGRGDKRGKRGGFCDNSDCSKIINMIVERNFAPVIVFSFSKKECEAYAVSMIKMDFNSDEEKSLVEEIFKNAMDALSDEDKNLPQVQKLLPVLKKGIGIHHGGLLPLLKETIEILFSEGLIKALFATETFAMGLNMPARTVLFTNAKKFDGHEYRWMTSGEYIQMSGRAGRRGIDSRGTAILVVNDEMSPSIGKKIVKGLPDSITSAFHLTYNMVLNLLRVEEVSPEYMLEKSFSQFQNYSKIPELCEHLKKLYSDFNVLEIPNEEDVAMYHRIHEELKALEVEAHSYIVKPENCINFLQPGRMVKIINGENDFGWGMVVKHQKKSKHSVKNVTCIIDVLLHVSMESTKSRFSDCLKPPPPGEKGEMEIVPIKPDLIWQFSQICLCFPDNLQNRDNRMSVLKILTEVQARHPDGIPLLDPITDMKIKDTGLLDIMKKITSVKVRLESHPQHTDLKNVSNSELYCRKTKIAEEIKSVKDELKKAKCLLQMDELKCRKRVLRRLGFCSESDVIEIKGRVACEISTADELLITEMIFNGVFNNLSVYQTLALLSCFVCEEKSNELSKSKLSEELSGPLSVMQETARKIAKVSNEAKLDIDPEEYVDSFKPYLMDIVHSWSKGVTFKEICKMSDIFEGSIVRSMRRLEELLRQMCQAAGVIGNSEMENKFSEGIKLIKRDVIFAASLYL